MIQEKRKGISPIIATLLLILIAIAAGVIVYAYVIGFIGNSTTNSGGAISVVSVDNFCAGKTTGDCGVTGTGVFSVVIRNVGTVAISITTATVEPQLYFTDVTSGATASVACSQTTITVSPGQTYTCAGTLGFTPSGGDSINLKVIDPDSGAVTSSTKALA